MNQDKQELWYTNAYVWLVISIPAATVAGCMLTIYLALSNPDFLIDKTAVPTETSIDKAAQPRD